VEEQIKAAVSKSLDELKNMQAKLDDLIDELPKETEEIRQRAEHSLSQIGEKLQESLKQADEHTQEAQLQAHLGLMEAHDRLDASRKVVDDYLAMMEAQDFWETRGKQIAEEFEKSSEMMLSFATRAMSDMQVTLKNWNELFNRKP